MGKKKINTHKVSTQLRRAKLKKVKTKLNRNSSKLDVHKDRDELLVQLQEYNKYINLLLTVVVELKKNSDIINIALEDKDTIDTYFTNITKIQEDFATATDICEKISNDSDPYDTMSGILMLTTQINTLANQSITTFNSVREFIEKYRADLELSQSDNIKYILQNIFPITPTLTTDTEDNDGDKNEETSIIREDS